MEIKGYLGKGNFGNEVALFGFYKDQSPKAHPIKIILSSNTTLHEQYLSFIHDPANKGLDLSTVYIKCSVSSHNIQGLMGDRITIHSRMMQSWVFRSEIGRLLSTRQGGITNKIFIGTRSVVQQESVKQFALYGSIFNGLHIQYINHYNREMVVNSATRKVYLDIKDLLKDFPRLSKFTDVQLKVISDIIHGEKSKVTSLPTLVVRP